MGATLTQPAPTATLITDQTAQISWVSASGGTGPYTPSLYRSTTTGFTPGAGNLVALLPAGTLTYKDTGLIPNTVYYYAVQSTDSLGATPSAVNQLTMTSTLGQSLSQNVAVPTQIAGTVDQQFSSNSFEGMIDPSVTGNVYPGQAVMIYNSTIKGLTFVPCTAATDPVFGFVNYDFIHSSFTGGTPVSVSSAGNVVRLFATETIAKGAEVCLDITATAAVQASGHTGNTIVGYAMDQMSNNGVVGRVMLRCPLIPAATA